MAWGSWEWADAEVAQVRQDGTDQVLRLSAAQVRLAGHAAPVWMALEVRLGCSAILPDALTAGLLGRVRAGWVHHAGRRLPQHALPMHLDGSVVIELEMALGGDWVRLESTGLQVRALQEAGVDAYQC